MGVHTWDTAQWVVRPGTPQASQPPAAARSWGRAGGVGCASQHSPDRDCVRWFGILCSFSLLWFECSPKIHIEIWLPLWWSEEESLEEVIRSLKLCSPEESISVVTAAAVLTELWWRKGLAPHSSSLCLMLLLLASVFYLALWDDISQRSSPDAGMVFLNFLASNTWTT